MKEEEKKEPLWRRFFLFLGLVTGGPNTPPKYTPGSGIQPEHLRMCPKCGRQIAKNYDLCPKCKR